MTFVNSLLALGALAFTIPLVIHLLYRSRLITVDWGAMHLLGSVMQANRRRLQWTHWLLLLLRCSIPILLALCLARPLLTGFQALAGDAPQSVVLVIDNSRSMSARGESGETRIEQAKQQLVSMVGQLSRHDEVLLLPASGGARFADAMGPQAAAGALRQIRAESGPVDLASVLRLALDAAKEASHPHRQIILVSDFQSEMLDDSLLNSLDRLAAESEQPAPRPVISFWNVGGESERLNNVSVESVQVDSPAVIAGQTAEYSARLRNASDAPAAGVRVEWSIDGNRTDSHQLTLPARSATTVRLRHVSAEPGVHEVALAAEVADAMPADNRRRLAVDVIREIGVLLVDGEPSPRPLESETDFLAIALSPFAFGQPQQRSGAVRTRVVGPDRVADELASEPWDVVVLANVAELDSATQQAVVPFVHRGGGLIIFDGDSLKPQDYNRRWTSDELSLALPARLGPRLGDPAVREESAMQVGELNESFTPWSLLAPNDQRPLASVDLFAYRKLKPAGPALPPPTESTAAEDSPRGSNSPRGSDSQQLEETPSATVLLRVTGGDPLVVSARRGLGQVVQFAIPCDTAWSTLPLRPIFLPMMQQLVLQLAGTQTTATSMTSQPLVVPLTEFSSGSSSRFADSSPGDASRSAEFQYTVEPPRGGERTIQPTVDQPARLIHSDTAVPGTYRLRRSQHDGDGVTEVASTLRIVEVSADESLLRDAEPARLSAVADSLGATVYHDAASLRADDQVRRFGREVWRWLLAVLLVAMVAEVALQQSAVRRSRSGASG